MSQVRLYVAAAVVFLFILNVIVGWVGNSTPPPPIQTTITAPQKTLFKQPLKNNSFSNPLIAAKILNLLEPDYHPENAKLSKYCQSVLDYLVNHPQKAIKKMHFVTNYQKDMVANRVMKKLGQLTKSRTPKMKYSPDVNAFVETYGHDADQQIRACPHQLSNHILGNSWMGNKDTVAALYQEYKKRFEDKPQCLYNFMPETYILTKKDQCKAFFSFINSEKYAKKKEQYHIVFMEKLASGEEAHSANGVQPFTQERETRLRTLYDEGKLCGSPQIKTSNEYNIIMQSYISNPQLLEGHKFDMRVHLLIASSAPLIVYYYDGYFRTSLYKFNATSTDLTVHLSNNHAGRPEGMTPEDEKRIKKFNFDDLAKFLMDEGKIKSMKWIDNELRPKLQKAMLHLVNSAKEKFEKKPNYYEMYGCDFLLDTDFDIWFMECQSDPGFNKADSPKMMQGLWEITYGLLRSRIRRTIRFVNQLTTEIKEKHLGDTAMQKFIRSKQGEYDKINKNAFEEEFKIRKKNKFVKIIDESVKGQARYGNLFPSECTAVLTKGK